MEIDGFFNHFIALFMFFLLLNDMFYIGHLHSIFMFFK
ncbi:hypothetical protein B4134_3582 [Bacillus safensis]|nr:hypothetical protein B4107_2946 [Bacillus safensis]KIL24767.1 hypothetical protein B4134_3582 [Bacillus safensis]